MQTAALLRDALAVGLSDCGGANDSQPLLDALAAGADAAAAEMNAVSDYALLAPVIDAMETLRERMQHNSSCLTDLNAFILSASRLAPHFLPPPHRNHQRDGDAA